MHTCMHEEGSGRRGEKQWWPFLYRLTVQASNDSTSELTSSPIIQLCHKAVNKRHNIMQHLWAQPTVARDGGRKPGERAPRKDGAHRKRDHRRHTNACKLAAMLGAQSWMPPASTAASAPPAICAAT